MTKNQKNNKLKIKNAAKNRVHKKDNEINFSIVKVNYNKISLKNLVKESNDILNNKNTNLFSSGMFKLPCLSITNNNKTFNKSMSTTVISSNKDEII